MGSYLTGRSQSVQIESKFSPSINIGNYGAPQGSLLGGLLFIINENDFPNCRSEGESVLFVNDDSDLVHDSDSNKLIQKIQKEADLSCSWLKDNRMCVAGNKSKLLIIGTEELKKSRLGTQPISISVDGKVVNESISEKLLGIVISNDLTWRDHMYGENDGLLSALSKRLGVIKKLSQYCSRAKLSMIAEGIFYSKLRYGLPLLATTWGLEKYKDGDSRFKNLTKEDNRKLQVLQNQLCRIILLKGNLYKKQNIPTEQLLAQCNQLSVHQMGAYTTIIMVKKILQSGKPTYIKRRLRIQRNEKTRNSEAFIRIQG